MIVFSRSKIDRIAVYSGRIERLFVVQCKVESCIREIAVQILKYAFLRPQGRVIVIGIDHVGQIFAVVHPQNSVVIGAGRDSDGRYLHFVSLCDLLLNKRLRQRSRAHTLGRVLLIPHAQLDRIWIGRISGIAATKGNDYSAQRQHKKQQCFQNFLHGFFSFLDQPISILTLPKGISSTIFPFSSE